MRAERAFALRVAHQAGEILQRHFGRLEASQIAQKADRNPVTDIDCASEQHIVDQIRAAYPEDGILAEEQTRKNLDASRVWIIDPLDGTVNYTRSHPFVAVSIALAIAGRIEVGVVHAPMLGESWSAARGAGATRHRAYGEVACAVSTVTKPGWD